MLNSYLYSSMVTFQKALVTLEISIKFLKDPIIPAWETHISRVSWPESAQNIFFWIDTFGDLRTQFENTGSNMVYGWFVLFK